MPISPKGKKYKIKGKEMTLYPISALAKRLSDALGEERTTQTIRKWETGGILPPTIFRAGQKRLYHAKQMDIICEIAKEENIRQGVSFSQSKFIPRVREELKRVNAELIGKKGSKKCQ